MEKEKVNLKALTQLWRCNLKALTQLKRRHLFYLFDYVIRQPGKFRFVKKKGGGGWKQIGKKFPNTGLLLLPQKTNSNSYYKVLFEH